MTNLAVENELDHNMMPIEGCFRVIEDGCRELRHIYVSSADAAIRVYCEGNDLNYNEVSIKDRTQ